MSPTGQYLFISTRVALELAHDKRLVLFLFGILIALVLPPPFVARGFFGAHSLGLGVDFAAVQRARLVYFGSEGGQPFFALASS